MRDIASPMVIVATVVLVCLALLASSTRADGDLIISQGQTGGVTAHHVDGRIVTALGVTTFAPGPMREFTTTKETTEPWATLDDKGKLTFFAPHTCEDTLPMLVSKLRSMVDAAPPDQPLRVARAKDDRDWFELEAPQQPKRLAIVAYDGTVERDPGVECETLLRAVWKAIDDEAARQYRGQFTTTPLVWSR